MLEPAIMMPSKAATVIIIPSFANAFAPTAEDVIQRQLIRGTVAGIRQGG
ncbi:hypothetical protein GCM10008966_27510 [Rhodovulum strictum]